MPFSAGDLNAVLSEWREWVVGGRLQRIFHPKPDVLIFEIHRVRTYHLLLCMHAKLSRLHVTTRRFRNQQTPSGFCMFLRSRLQGARLEAVHQLNGDRIAMLEFHAPQSRTPGRYTLVAEVMGPRSNVLLLDDGRVVLQSIRHANSKDRSECIGKVYSPPPLNRPMQSSGPAPEDRTWNEYFDKDYLLLEARASFDEKHDLLTRTLARHLKKYRAKLRNVIEALQSAEDHVSQSRLGELLKANFHALKQGMATVTVVDYYQEDQPEITLTLDPRLAPNQNIDRYFKRARRMAGAQKHLRSVQAEVENELQHLETIDIERRLQTAETINDLVHIEDQLVEARILVHPKKKGARAPRRTGFRHFKSRQGYDIYVGRNNTDNDKLTCHFARGNDVWMHVGGFPGSHVLIRTQRGTSVPQDSILDAVQLAKYYSKARDHQKAEVLVTQKKYVSKPKGARPGLVTLSQFNPYWVQEDLERLDRLRHSVERQS